MVLPPDRRKGRKQRLEEEAAAASAAETVVGNGGSEGADTITEPGDTIWVDGDEEKEPRVDDAGRRRE